VRWKVQTLTSQESDLIDSPSAVGASQSSSIDPVEVILPPPVKPFQRKTYHDVLITPKSSLRVTAPEFEPSYAGAWTPFSNSPSQFSGLFKIPTRESRKIEIVSPSDKKKANGTHNKDRLAQLRTPTKVPKSKTSSRTNMPQENWASNKVGNVRSFPSTPEYWQVSPKNYSNAWNDFNEYRYESHLTFLT
jgi:hypothetical protein